MANHTSCRDARNTTTQWNTERVTDDLNGDLADITERLRVISEELADRALVELKEAHRSGATKRPESEKSLSQARRAVEKAIAILSRADSGD